MKAFFLGGLVVCFFGLRGMVAEASEQWESSDPAGSWNSSLYESTGDFSDNEEDNFSGDPRAFLKHPLRLQDALRMIRYSPDECCDLSAFFAALPSEYHRLLSPSISYKQIKQLCPETFHPIFLWLLELSLLQQPRSKPPRAFQHGRLLANKIGLPTSTSRVWCELADPDERWAQVSSREELDAQQALRLSMHFSADPARQAILLRRAEAVVDGDTKTVLALQALFGDISWQEGK